MGNPRFLPNYLGRLIKLLSSSDLLELKRKCVTQGLGRCSKLLRKWKMGALYGSLADGRVSRGDDVIG